MSTTLALLCTLTCWPGGIAAFSDKNHPRTLRCGWAGLRCGSRGFDFPFIYPFSKKKQKKSVMSALCHERLTWPIDASRGDVARWKAGREMASAHITVERGVVGFGLDYSCAHIIILAEISSVNLLPIQADFVTERDK